MTCTAIGTQDNPKSTPRHRCPFFIVNPSAAGGRAGRRWTEEIVPRLQVSHENVVTTAYPGHAAELARSAAESHAPIIAVGGDGTVHEVVSGLMAVQRHRPPLGILPLGTGNDIARSVGLRSGEDALKALERAHTRPLDLIRVDCLEESVSVTRFACLTASAGISAMVIRSLRPWMKRWLGSENAYMLATLIALVRYRPSQMQVQWPDGDFTGKLLMVNVGNAEYESGGGMRMSPGARIDDGMVNISIIRAAPLPRLLRKLPGIRTGAHIHEPEVVYFLAARVQVDSDPPVGIQMDGDIRGHTPATFTVLPHALQVIA